MVFNKAVSGSIEFEGTRSEFVLFDVCNCMHYILFDVCVWTNFLYLILTGDQIEYIIYISRVWNFSAFAVHLQVNMTELDCSFSSGDPLQLIGC